MLVRVGPTKDGAEEKEALFVNPDHVAAVYPSRCEGETTIKLSCGEEVYVDEITPTELARQLNAAITAIA